MFFIIDASRREHFNVAPLHLPQKQNVVDVKSLHQQSTNKRTHSNSYIKHCFVGCDNTKELHRIQVPVSKEVPGGTSRL